MNDRMQLQDVAYYLTSSPALDAIGPVYARENRELEQGSAGLHGPSGKTSVPYGGVGFTVKERSSGLKNIDNNSKHAEMLLYSYRHQY